MPNLQTQDRSQMMLSSLDMQVAPDSIARVIDVFINGLDLESLGFQKVTPAIEGRPSYGAYPLMRLYLYGHQKTLRSSRKLSESCKINIEVKWLMEGLEPDFRTISDFRKDNISSMKKVFHAFNHKLSEVLQMGFLSVDGSKFQANNGKDRNFTANKLDDRIKWLNQHSDEYLRQIAEMDETEESLSGQFTKEELEKKLAETTERLERYKAYRSYMEKEGLSQISLTDTDAKLMKSKNGFMVAYNVQTAVDSETHLIADYQLTNHPTDHGLLASTTEEERERREEIVEVVADKGYNTEEDMVRCLENGIIPHVILPEGQDAYELEIVYDERDITEEKKSSILSADLKECLHSGVVPDAYSDFVESATVVEKRVLVKEEDEKTASLYDSEDKKLERAKEGYFVRDPERNLVYCPAGETLRQKAIKNNGDIRYANKLACRHCKNRNRCYKGKLEWKEVDFNKDTLEKPNRNWINNSEALGQSETPLKKYRKGHYEIRKVVRLILKPDRKKMSQRQCLSEHPFGTIKRAMDAGYYLLRGKRKVDGETALICLAYNIKRALNLFGFQKMMKVMA